MELKTFKQYLQIWAQVLILIFFGIIWEKKLP